MTALHRLSLLGAALALVGCASVSPDGLRSDVRKNLEREVKFRVQARNKRAVMEALVSKAELDLPNASVQAELARQAAERAQLEARRKAELERIAQERQRQARPRGPSKEGKDNDGPDYSPER